MSTWGRIESTARSVDLTDGLAARIADPLWMLARQWQVSEFRGDDAAQPAAVRMARRTAAINSLRGISGEPRPMRDAVPLEAVVEGAPVADLGTAGLHAAARATRRLIRMLTDEGTADAVATLRGEFPLGMPERAVTFGNSGAQAAELIARKAFDCAAVAAASTERLSSALSGPIQVANPALALSVIARWREWCLRREPRAGDVAWDEERLEYRFAVSVGGASPKELPVVDLAAPEHDGTHLDWYTFDVARDAADAECGRTRVLTAIPAPVTYQGMPASRWWQFEDGTVNFGDLDAGPADLARLLVAEFATVYGDDWFVVPVAVPVGSITEIRGIEILDNFNHRTTIASTALNDERRTGGRRVWRAFELAGDAVSKDHPSPWMFVPPTLASQVDGPLLEHVILARDEGANLAWAIERIVEGPLGRGIDRGEAWHAAAAGVPVPNKQAPAARTPFAYDEQWWRYRLELPTPPWWIPFVPERVTQEGAEVRLRRARMHSWEPLAAGPAAAAVGPQGMLLDPRRPCWLYEEEVPRSGVRIERRWQFARWHDGSFHVWLQRRKLAGKGERSSGMRWDMLERGVQPL